MADSTALPGADLDPRLAAIRNFQGKYPKQLWWLFLSEMWERFCFYGMRGALTVFMISQLAMKKDEANLRYGAIQAFVYTMTFVGGFFSDKILGFRRSIFWGGLLMVAGSFTIAFSPQETFWIGTSISIVGTGFFKPNISGVVGQLYHDGDPRRDAGFSLFYSGINLGAFFGGFVCVGLGESPNYGWGWAFASTGCVMLFGLTVFALTSHTLEPLGHSPLLPKNKPAAPGANLKIFGTYALSLAMIPLVLLLVRKNEYTDPFMYTVGPVVLVYFIWCMLQCSPTEMRKLVVALVLILFSVFFWAFFEQSGGSLAIVSKFHLDKSFGEAMNPIWINNSANSLFVIAFSPLLGIVWLKMGKGEPGSVVKFALGFFFLAAAFFLFSSLIQFASPQGVSSLAIFTVAYFVITVGELCLSPIGLSAMTKLTPRHMYGIIMGMWFLASAYGQYFAGVLGAGMASADKDATPLQQLTSYTDGYQQLAIYAVVFGVALLILSPMLKKLTGNTN